MWRTLAKANAIYHGQDAHAASFHHHLADREDGEHQGEDHCADEITGDKISEGNRRWELLRIT
jgi:hypothetical protein